MVDPEQVGKLVRTAVDAAEKEGERVAMVIIDTVARAIPGADENSAQDMGRFVAAVEAIRAGVSCHVLGVHHSGKDADKGARGSSALLGGVDTMIKVKRDGERLTVTIEKQKDEDEGAPIQLRTKVVEIGNGLKSETSLVLVEDASPIPAAPEDPHVADLSLAAQALGRNGRMTANQIATSLGWSGRRKQDIMDAIPFAPDYREVSVPGLSALVRVARTRRGSGVTSPLEVARYDVE
jgi:hypothetical protein